jgi:Tol biopolymer transport system component/DNA-binding winged helix-turn-helix (wHTH) protein
MLDSFAADFGMPSTDKVQFGVFELDLQQAELRKQGVKVKLQEQPLRVLQLLLQNHGQIVSREELRTHIWSANTFVEFDQGLYSAMARLRDALGDSSESPRFIETVARRGYRFIAPVDISEPARPAARTTQTVPKPGTALRRFLLSLVAGLLGGALLIGLLLGFDVAGVRQWLRHGSGRPIVQRRLTDFVGLEEFPAISLDGKTVAFTADNAGYRQVWVRLIAGGTLLQITHDNVDHMYPRWSPDSSTLIYYSPPTPGEEQGTLWEISALGGTPRPLTRSVSSADISHDGKKLAFFRLGEKNTVQLVTVERLTSLVSLVAELPSSQAYEYPRWSPDDYWIAFQHSTLYVDDISYVSAFGGDVHPLTHEGVLMGGLSWQPDGSGIIYSSGRESTVIYLPTMHLWAARLDGSPARQMTYGETSLYHPDADRQGNLVASRLRMQYDIWKYPVTGTPRKNTHDGQQLTHETGQVQTPNATPGGRELAYLSDDGGHGNIWVLDLVSGASRQITFETDPHVSMGLPMWSPDGSKIAMVSTRDEPNWDTLGVWLVDADGSNLHRLLSQMSGYPTWSGDGKWLYYSTMPHGIFHIFKTPVTGGAPVLVRNDNACVSALGADGSTLYYSVPHLNGNGIRDYEIRAAHPESGPSLRLAQIAGERVPHWQVFQPSLSHGGRWLALPLNDLATTNLYLVSTIDGSFRQVTDFSPRRTFIVRRVAWSSDDRDLFAAVGDGDADIVLIDGLLLSR